MARKPKVWFDVDYLSSLGDGPGELYFLSEQSQQILSQLAEIVRWETRWFDSSGSPVDLPSMAHDVYEELKVPLHLDDLITAINTNNAALLAKLDEQILATVESVCCPTMSVTIPTGVYTLPGGGTLDGLGDADSVPYSDVEIGVTDLPVTSATDPDGDGIIGPNGARYYLCGAAHWMLEQMVSSLRHQANVRRSLGNVAEAVEFVAKIVVAWIIPGWADDIALMEPDKYPGWASLFLETGADALDVAADTIEASKDAIAQEVACANTSDGMLSLLTAALGASIGVSGIVTMLTTGPWRAVVNLIYHGAIEAGWRDVCDCTETYPVDVTYDFLTSNGGWSGGATGALGDATWSAGNGWLIDANSFYYQFIYKSRSGLMADAGLPNGSVYIDKIEITLAAKADGEGDTVSLNGVGSVSIRTLLSGTHELDFDASLPLADYYQAIRVNSRTSSGAFRVTGMRVMGYLEAQT